MQPIVISCEIQLWFVYVCVCVHVYFKEVSYFGGQSWRFNLCFLLLSSFVILLKSSTHIEKHTYLKGTVNEFSQKDDISETTVKIKERKVPEAPLTLCQNHHLHQRYAIILISPATGWFCLILNFKCIESQNMYSFRLNVCDSTVSEIYPCCEMAHHFSLLSHVPLHDDTTIYKFTHRLMEILGGL